MIELPKQENADCTDDDGDDQHRQLVRQQIIHFRFYTLLISKVLNADRNAVMEKMCEDGCPKGACPNEQITEI